MSSAVLPRSRPLAADSLMHVLARSGALLTFLIAAAVLGWMYGNRLILSTNDEGIYLDAAERILHGQKPYVDFFGYMSPGSFWMLALVFRIFGLTLAASHGLVIFYAALECALVYGLVRRFASPGAAVATAFLFFAFQTNDPDRMTAQHRWDSGALSLAAIALCVSPAWNKRRWPFAASGALMALAAFATPSVALLSVVTFGWLAWSRDRAGAGWFLSGTIATGMVLILALYLNGILAPLAGQIAWLSRNYSAVNVMPYGSIIGGYRALFEGASVWELPIRTWLVFCIALPAVLPLTGLAAGAAVLARAREFRRVLVYLMLCVAALVITVYPRADVEHLSFIAPLAYALIGILSYRFLPARARTWLMLWMALWAASFFVVAAVRQRGQELPTPIGGMRVTSDEGQLLTGLLARVHPHDSLFVFPYKPLLYFLTQAENPTRYSYLAPGMMTPADAALVLADLKRKPPAWVLYMEVAPADYERVFPAAAGLALHYRDLEEWLKANYRASGSPPITGYVLMQRAQ